MCIIKMMVYEINFVLSKLIAIIQVSNNKCRNQTINALTTCTKDVKTLTNYRFEKEDDQIDHVMTNANQLELFTISSKSIKHDLNLLAGKEEHFFSE